MNGLLSWLLTHSTAIRLSSAALRYRVEAIAAKFEQYRQQTNTWASSVAPQFKPQQPVAYFSIEFGLHPCLPTYSGSLGILAADNLKSASDLGLPLVAVSLIYRQ